MIFTPETRHRRLRAFPRALMTCYYPWRQVFPPPLTNSIRPYVARDRASAGKSGRSSMFEALFGPEMPLAARFFLAFVVVLALIGGAAYAVRRVGCARLGSNIARGRQPRLAVIDAAAVDSRRRLVLIRR